MSATLQKILVVTHSADYDGLFSQEIARQHFGAAAEYVGWDYGNPQLQFPKDHQVYIIDLSPDCFEQISEEDFKRVVWIDHHRTAIEKFPASIPGYRIDGVAACRLAYQWFLLHQEWDPRELHPPYDLPTKEQYVKREVPEPWAVMLAGEYDVWDHRDNDADVAFQFGLDAQAKILWSWLLDMGQSKAHASLIIEDGRAAMACYAKRDADIMRERSMIVDFEGLKFLCLNTARCNSNTFTARDKPETGHDALMGFYMRPDGSWSFSMYHAAHRKDLDLSRIAKEYGGGGHPGACGFISHGGIPFSINGQLVEL